VLSPVRKAAGVGGKPGPITCGERLPGGMGSPEHAPEGVRGVAVGKACKP